MSGIKFGTTRDSAIADISVDGDSVSLFFDVQDVWKPSPFATTRLDRSPTSSSSS